MLKDLVTKSRSYRRFYEEEAVDEATMRELVELAWLSPTGANMQPFKLIVSCTPEKNALIFPTLVWAGYLPEWDGPAEGERPTAYVIILGDTEIARSYGCSHGILAQSMMLGATEKGLGGCMIGSIRRERLVNALGIPERYEILLALALGKPKEKVVLEDMEPGGDIEYWRDADGVHHVPKRPVDELLLDL